MQFDPVLHYSSILTFIFLILSQIHGEDNVGAFEVKFNGSDVSVLVMSPEEYKLSRHMKEPKPTDTSNFILSPMPGTLISYAVEVSFLLYHLFWNILILT